MARTFDSILADARQELRDRWADDRDGFYQGEPHDAIHEIADSSVPIYYSDIFAVLADLPSYELSDPGIAEGVTDLSKLAQIHIYDAISMDLFESWEEIKREAGDDNEDGDES
jgi:hypothetical protein